MAILKSLIKLGVAAGAVYAGMKVSDRYKENNPDGVKSTPDKFDAIKQAAEEVYYDFSYSIKEKAPDIQSGLNDTIQKVSEFASEKMPNVAEKVQNAVDKIAEKAPEFAEKVQNAVDNVTEKVTGTAKDAEDNFEEVVDAEFTTIDEEE